MNHRTKTDIKKISPEDISISIWYHNILQELKKQPPNVPKFNKSAKNTNKSMARSQKKSVPETSDLPHIFQY